MPTHLRFTAALIASIAVAACSSASSATNAVLPPSTGPTFSQTGLSRLGPFVVAMNGASTALEIWPLRQGGGSHPKAFSDPLGIGAVTALATKGDLIAIAAQNPSRVVLYDFETRGVRTLGDPFGAPTDVTIGSDRTIYVNDVPRSGTSVAVYRPPSHRPVELTCAALQTTIYIAVDDENDIFLQGYGPQGGAEVAEIPAGSQNCTGLPLKTDGGYAAGIVVDPKSDDLVTLDDPSLCAGGAEGRMTVYPKPYDIRTATSRVLGFECAAGLRLSADSTYVLIGDTNLSNPLILQRTFPEGGDAGIYHGVNMVGITTVPGP